jgi:DNA-binding GntR family transcriptional regulator
MIRFIPARGGPQVYIELEGRTVVLSASDLENILKAIAAGTYEVASELLQQLIDAAIQQQAQQQTGQSPP